MSSADPAVFLKGRHFVRRIFRVFVHSAATFSILPFPVRRVFLFILPNISGLKMTNISESFKNLPFSVDKCVDVKL